MGKKGFTLVEVSLAAIVLGIIGVAILATFGSGLKVYERLQSYGIIQADVLIALEEMERNLRNVFPMTEIGFVGTQNSISFPGVIESIDDKGKTNSLLGRLTYSMDYDKEVLILKRESYLQESFPDAINDEKVLASLKNIYFQFYVFDAEAQTFSWMNSWDQGNVGVLKGVKIEATFDDAARSVVLKRKVFLPVGIDQTAEEEEEGEEEKEDASQMP